MAALTRFLAQRDPEDTQSSNLAWVLLVHPLSEAAPTLVALSLDGDQGTSAGTFWFYALAGGKPKPLGELESQGEGSHRFFRTKRGTTIFRAFWFQRAEPSPRDTHVGKYEEFEIAVSGIKALHREKEVDVNLPRGKALWAAPRGTAYSCDLESFRKSGYCPLEKLGE
ncbi:Hypothetical protein A7982_02265 [Minicystis rosea]|nr:Hypothetical protein A7982_02265 [Minicystis rosea]